MFPTQYLDNNYATYKVRSINSEYKVGLKLGNFKNKSQ